MPDRIEACFFVTEPPDIQYRDGMFHIVQVIGNYRFERCMLPATFMQTVVRFVEAARQHRVKRGLLFDLPRLVEDEEAHAAVGSLAK